jgi:CspA family cold shock protein
MFNTRISPFRFVVAVLLLLSTTKNDPTTGVFAWTTSSIHARSSSGIGSIARTRHLLFMGEGETEIFQGTVKWFDNTKGFGFITRESDGEDIFVHQTAIQAEGFRALEDGASVEFQVQVVDGKTCAAQVTGPGGEKLKRGFAYKKRDD